MLQNYLKIAFRNLVRNKVYSFINIVGLSFGMAVAMLIFLFVSHEVSYDKFHVNGDRIYQVSSLVKYGEQEVNFTAMSAKLAPIVKKNNSEVIDFVRVKGGGDPIFLNPKNPTQKFKEDNFDFVDNSFFSVFSFQLKEGNPKFVLKEPFSLVITEKIAKKYFGNDNPIGKILTCNSKDNYTITGILKETPSNSSMSFDILSSIDTYPLLGKTQKATWDSVGIFETYFLLNSEKSIKKVATSIKASGKLTGVFDEKTTYSLNQFSSQHLGGGFNDNQNARYVYIFAGIALLILFLALFNYMSLTTARATTRAKEVGIRKVVGAGRNGLIKQFYIESILVCSISFGLAFIFIELLLQPFYNLLEVQIDSSFLTNPLFLLAVIALFIFSAFVSGSYPALLLSRFIPIEVIKGKFTSGQGGKSIRKWITVFQFTVSVVLIISVIITQKQVNYMKNKDLGFTKDQVLAIDIDSSMAKNYLSLKNDIRQLTGIKAITSVTTPFFKGYNAWFVKSHKSKKDVMLYSMVADENFFKTVDLQWINTPTNMENLTKKLFINEEAVKQLELSKNKDIIGQSVTIWEDKREIGGVLKDFNFAGLKEKIGPLNISIYKEGSTDWIMPSGFPTIYVRLDPKSEISEKISTIKYLYEKYHSANPFTYSFLDEDFNKTFSTEMRLSKMFSLFTGFAIFIACMGLFGLVAFAAETRTKEIGIRKVLGASVSNIVSLLSKDFVKLILISFVIAFPIAWWAMNKWLEAFAYRINIEWNIFAIAGVFTLLIALLTVSYQAIKAAVANPVKSLRTE
jgi:putative ABC transport system permease protein